MFECDGDVEVCESAKRAVRETAKLLTDKGHKVSAQLSLSIGHVNKLPRITQSKSELHNALWDTLQHALLS